MNGTEAAEATVIARKSRRVCFDIIPLYQLENLLVNVTAAECICKRFSGPIQCVWPLLTRFSLKDSTGLESLVVPRKS